MRQPGQGNIVWYPLYLPYPSLAAFTNDFVSILPLPIGETLDGWFQ